LLLSRLVYSSDETLDISLVSKAILVLLSRRDIVCDVYLTVLAKVSLFGDPVFAHGMLKGK